MCTKVHKKAVSSNTRVSVSGKILSVHKSNPGYCSRTGQTLASVKKSGWVTPHVVCALVSCVNGLLSSRASCC